MKIYKNVEQKSLEWHQLRYGKVGGSTLDKVMANENKPIENNAIFYQLLAELTEDYIEEDTYSNEAMERGNDLEPLAADYYSLIHSVKCDKVGWIEQDDNFSGISPDRLIGSNKALEIKCPSKAVHARYMLNPIELANDYIWQIVMYFVVIDNLEELIIISYRPENKVLKMVEFNVNLATELKVNSKKSASISQLVTEAKIRLSELKTKLDLNINKLNEINY